MSKKHYTMRELPNSERPYEKCERLGAASLSDAELLSVIIRTGTKSSRAVEVAIQILNAHKLHKGLIGLHYLTQKDLMTINGIGKVKATQIQCVAELAKRLSKTERQENVSFRCPRDIADYFMEEMRVLETEQVRLLMLDNQCRLMKEMIISKGTVGKSLSSPREIFKTALNYSAVSIVLIHNHPSGNPQPSKEDINITKTLGEAGILIEIPLTDHIIIGDHQYTSMRECGYI